MINEHEDLVEYPVLWCLLRHRAEAPHAVVLKHYLGRAVLLHQLAEVLGVKFLLVLDELHLCLCSLEDIGRVLDLALLAGNYKGALTLRELLVAYRVEDKRGLSALKKARYHIYRKLHFAPPVIILK